MTVTVKHAELFDTVHAHFLMDLISCLGPTPVTIDYYMGETGGTRSQVKHALDYLTTIGIARKETGSIFTCWAKAEK